MITTSSTLQPEMQGASSASDISRQTPGNVFEHLGSATINNESNITPLESTDNAAWLELIKVHPELDDVNRAGDRLIALAGAEPSTTASTIDQVPVISREREVAQVAIIAGEAIMKLRGFEISDEVKRAFPFN